MKNIVLAFIVLISTLCASAQNTETDTTEKSTQKWISINRDITIAEYFEYLDSVIDLQSPDMLLTEHLLIRANPRIIDSLANTDYYLQIAKDRFVFDQKASVVLHKGDSLRLPDPGNIKTLSQTFQITLIDINIPEFKLRIYEDSVLIHTYPIRVGRNEKKFLAVNNRVTNLQTITGDGYIVRYEKDPVFINPVDGKRFYLTKRDDNRTTLMPRIPWIETKINGIHNGQMIHPTTNPVTLGLAYSNGCIGTNESDMWHIYYYAPIGTKVRIRYDLNVVDTLGVPILLKDIYLRALETNKK
ncbi:L,D-transpeptidase [Robertkochia solimangrovi]|uniref:L,D-transpeptidase n=1 Tax=Robertkochia solimangrovi TaxID=2213046 RepID=UPI00118134DA|nr:L,D-transpeptidase [Robertkochia solimangrovi]TRZ40986.1 L,D-transpeptidase [Robertkochia solimangrovi]